MSIQNENSELCSVEDCGYKARIKGLCKQHYMEKWRADNKGYYDQYSRRLREYNKQRKKNLPEEVVKKNGRELGEVELQYIDDIKKFHTAVDIANDLEISDRKVSRIARERGVRSLPPFLRDVVMTKTKESGNYYRVKRCKECNKCIIIRWGDVSARCPCGAKYSVKWDYEGEDVRIKRVTKQDR